MVSGHLRRRPSMVARPTLRATRSRRRFGPAFFGSDDSGFAGDVARLGAARALLAKAAPDRPSDELFWSDPFSQDMQRIARALDLAALRLIVEPVIVHLRTAQPPLQRRAAAAMLLAAWQYDALARALQIGGGGALVLRRGARERRRSRRRRRRPRPQRHEIPVLGAARHAADAEGARPRRLGVREPPRAGRRGARALRRRGPARARARRCGRRGGGRLRKDARAPAVRRDSRGPLAAPPAQGVPWYHGIRAYPR